MLFSPRTFALAALGGAAIALSGCATTPIAPKTANLPSFQLETYFEGRTEAWGVFQERGGALTRQFKVVITGTVDGNTLILDEQFDYSDGEKQQRIWTIKKTSPTTYEGTAADVVGVAKGIVQGNQLSWTYDVRLPIGKNGLVTTFDDRMWLQSDGVLINRAIVKKFGVRVAEVTIAFKRPIN